MMQEKGFRKGRGRGDQKRRSCNGRTAHCTSCVRISGERSSKDPSSTVYTAKSLPFKLQRLVNAADRILGTKTDCVSHVDGLGVQITFKRSSRTPLNGLMVAPTDIIKQYYFGSPNDQQRSVRPSVQFQRRIRQFVMWLRKEPTRTVVGSVGQRWRMNPQHLATLREAFMNENVPTNAKTTTMRRMWCAMNACAEGGREEGRKRGRKGGREEEEACKKRDFDRRKQQHKSTSATRLRRTFTTRVRLSSMDNRLRNGRRLSGEWKTALQCEL